MVNSSKETYDLLIHLWDVNKIDLQEEFKVLLLSRSSRVLGIYHISTGSITGTIADPRLIFSAALKANATSMILAHNHPSGSLSPSSSDKMLTAKMVSAGQFLDIRVLDHLIVSSEGYYSFADEGGM